MKEENIIPLPKRIMVCIIGNILVSLGIALAKIAALGSDPFNGMCLSVSAFFNWEYWIFNWICNLIFFACEFIWGRKYINVGTVLNWFMVGYIADFFMKLYSWVFPEAKALYVRIPLLIFGIIALAFGIALYQQADWGIAPYDALPIIAHDYFPKIPYFWCRMIEDGLCVVGMALTITPKAKFLGAGTVVFAFCMGPVIHLFTKLLTRKKASPDVE